MSEAGLTVDMEVWRPKYVGQLTAKVQARYLIACGWLCLAVAMFYSTKRIDLQISLIAANWLRIAQVIGLGFLFVPISLVAYIGIAPEENNAVAGLINFMRNMGSSVGTSMVTNLIARRSQFHQETLGDYVCEGSPNFQNLASGLAQRLANSGLSAPDAQKTRLCPDLSARPGARRELGLRRYVYGPGGWFSHHVLSRFCLEEEHTGRRW